MALHTIVIRLVSSPESAAAPRPVVLLVSASPSRWTVTVAATQQPHAEGIGRLHSLSRSLEEHTPKSAQ